MSNLKKLGYLRKVLGGLIAGALVSAILPGSILGTFAIILLLMVVYERLRIERHQINQAKRDQRNVNEATGSTPSLLAAVVAIMFGGIAFPILFGIAFYTNPLVPIIVVSSLVIALIAVEYKYRQLRRAHYQNANHQNALANDVEAILSELDDAEQYTHDLMSKVDETAWYDVAEKLIRLETSLLHYRRQIQKLKKRMDNELLTVEKEVSKLAQQVDALSSELIDIQEEINLRRLKDTENTGERLRFQDEDSMLYPQDVMDDTFGSNPDAQSKDEL